MANVREKSGIGSGRHGQARQLAEEALDAEARGDEVVADRLFAQADKTDAGAVADVLQEHPAADPAPPPAETLPASDEELARYTEEVRPGSDAPSRAGITGPGSGADSMNSGGGGPVSKV